ncbi:MAG: putative 10 drug/metabolite exporter, family, superfamily [Candidatus Sulfotelmatobacter sp.]|nr:putative 10 drug/metabolite exporter, family, superfamily [Candidatus Sulfotelmatobacter sp.]
MNHRVRQILPFLFLAAAGSLWGTGFLFGKIAFYEMTVSENVAFRFLVAAVALSPVLLWRRQSFRAKDWRLLLLAALIGVPVQFLLQFKGLQLTTVSHASLIVGVLPVLLALSSAVFLNERLHGVEWGMLALSATGAVLIAFSSRNTISGPQPTAKGDFLVLLAMFAAVAMTLCTKRLVNDYDALHVTATMMVAGMIMLLIWVELTHPLRFHFSPKTWVAVVAQGLLATAAAYLFWNLGLSRIPASRAGIFLNLEPVVGTLLGVAILHEKLGKMALLGGILIVGAAVYFSRRSQSASKSITAES